MTEVPSDSPTDNTTPRWTDLTAGRATGCKSSLKILERHLISRKDERYISFPDVICRPDGVLLAVFRESDQHYPPTAPLTELIFVESHDRGRTWVNERIFADYPRDHEHWGWHCARLSMMADGRICLICDLASVTQPCTVPYLYFSSDGGETWGKPVATDLKVGIPDRLIEFSDREWGFAGQWYKSDPVFRPYAVFCSTEDGGRTWSERAIISDKKPYHFCEPSVVKLPSGRLLAFLRENSFIHFPTFVTHSDDNGRTWSDPELHPTNGQRPCAGYIEPADRESGGRILVTYRNVSGNPGLAAWLGGVEDRGWKPGGKDLTGECVSLSDEGLMLDVPPLAPDAVGGGSDSESPWKEEDERERDRTTLDPAEIRVVGVEYNVFSLRDWDGEVALTAIVKNLGGEEKSCVLRAGGVLEIYTDSVRLFYRPEDPQTNGYRINLADFRIEPGVFHRYRLSCSGRRLTLAIDGEEVFDRELDFNPVESQRKIAFGNYALDPANCVRFARNGGRSIWQYVGCDLTQSDGEQLRWSWDTTRKDEPAQYPNQYEIDYVRQVDLETSGELWECGYSGWTKLEDGLIYCVDYRRCEAKNPYVVGYLISY